jgi:hypothetical protein
MINAMEEKRAMQVEEQQLPMAFARAVDVDSTFAYMGSLMSFLAKGSETGGRFALMEYRTKIWGNGGDLRYCGKLGAFSIRL